MVSATVNVLKVEKVERIGILAIIVLLTIVVGFFALSTLSTPSTPSTRPISEVVTEPAQEFLPTPEERLRARGVPVMTVDELYRAHTNGEIQINSIIRVAGTITYKVSPGSRIVEGFDTVKDLDFLTEDNINAGESILFKNSVLFYTSTFKPGNQEQVICDFDVSISKSKMSNIKIGQTVVFEGVYSRYWVQEGERHANLLDCQIIE